MTIFSFSKSDDKLRMVYIILKLNRTIINFNFLFYFIKKREVIFYSKRNTIGQFTILPVEPNGFPPGPVIHPCSTKPKNWNS